MESYENIHLNKREGQHLYIQLYKAIKEMVLGDVLKEGDRLPPVRKMSKMMEVNNVTVVKAYEILEQEGLVYKKIGSGTYVSHREKEIKDNLGEEVDSNKKITLMEQGQIKIEENMINFASATPSAELFPVEDFKKVLNEVLDRDKGYAFGYQEGQGYYPLRQILGEYVAQYGINTEIDNIQIISGAQQGIDLVSKALLSYGDYVIIESPSYTGAMAAFQSRGAKIIDIPLQEDGLNLDILEKKIQAYNPKLLYIMPNFQNPTGISYTQEKKEKLLELCSKYGVYIMEDDYLSELNYYSEDIGNLKQMDDEEIVVYVKSFSKIFMPGLRLGFMVIPGNLHGRLLRAKHTSDISTSGLLQRALELYLKRGTWQEHLRYMEKKYQERFDKMNDCIQRYMPTGVEVIKPKGGVNFWFKLPNNYSSQTLYEKVVKDNVVFAPGNLFYLDNQHGEYFRLSIAAVNLIEIETGMKILCRHIDSYINNQEPINRGSFIKPIL
ncbi:MocR-like pyridoxine biosynthesis transcription factor PdxR [Alkaliphilus hydrothermalis]|uniref:DNA-binding transcriptional MocR family regulator n=1 Tax=Alkaliphilus hydrothermalis TaxID=1482730 RepID=A0ABS2NPH3_9FIRM|nr:PLP-dependent aminotransferase family protein [Alkaliphilus hydrothermalis]MBM7614851.1 DNA-binding transcriptional MocR family regulator [Alkaliphilus hydrothermalis]